MRRNWILKPVDQKTVDRLAAALDIPPIIARLLIHRQAQTPEQAHSFLCSDLGKLGDPRLMADLPKAVQLIRQAILFEQKILIAGDYDADGLTGSSLLWWVIHSLGADAAIHIPHRLEDGYGLKKELIAKAAKDGVKLLISVDCGTTSFEELALAHSHGIKTVVVDHHDLEQDKHPPADAFLNPLRLDCAYPEKDLASVGVAFTLARGLMDEEPSTGYKVPGTSVFEHLDLVALGTVADMASLVGENRILVKAGLHGISGSRKPGIRALLTQAGLDGETLAPEEISFMLAPPINAAGRIGSALESLRLLTTSDPDEAQALAKNLSKHNRNRAGLEREAFKKALVKISREINFAQDRVIVLQDERWHPGVIGILASKISNRFHRPTVVIAANGESCRGSARSIQSFHLVEALHAVREHLVAFGGHPGAAGLTIARANVDLFKQALNRFAQERIAPEQLSPTLNLDGELPLADLTQELIRDLEALGPYGLGNPRPVFISKDAKLSASAKPAGFSRFGVKLRVETSAGQSFDAIQPREALAGSWNVRRMTGPVHLAYSPLRRRQPEGEFSIELRLKDLKLT